MTGEGPDAPPRLRALTYALALLATPVLHGLSFPLAGRHLLAWVTFVPWFAAVRLARAHTALLLTAVTTLAGTYLVASWLPRAVAGYYAQPLALGVALFVGAWCVTLAPWVLAFTLCYRAMARRAAPTLPLLVGAAWVGIELCRVRLLAGDPFGLLGYTQVDVAPLVQIADVTGVYGVSFMVAAANAALAELWVALASRRGSGPALAGMALVSGVVAAAAGYGVARLAAATPSAPPATPVVVAQPNLDLGTQWREELYGRNLDDYMRLTGDALAGNRAALVVWPESAMTFFVEREPMYRSAIGDLLSRFGAQLLAGGPRTDGAPEPRYYNAAFLFSPEGRILARYEKERLLPFAEYFPLSSVGLLRRRFAHVREFTPGSAGDPLPTAAGPAGVVICNEAMFPEIVGRRVRAGAGFLVNLSNDSWLGDAQFSAQALDMARLRAVEQRRWLVRASTSGPSAIIDPTGAVVVRTDPFTRATMGGGVRASTEITVYGRWGDTFAVACAVVALLAALAGIDAIPRRRGRGPSSAGIRPWKQRPRPRAAAGPAA